MTDSKKADLCDRMQTRERLKIEKPIVYNKFIELDAKLNKGEAPPPVIEIGYRYDCNLKCKHCFASLFDKKEKSLSLLDMKNLSEQANELGIYQFILQGGEPLYWPDFDDVVNAINPKEFYMGLVTNATLLNREKIIHLRNIGIDKIVMSLDSYDVDQFEGIRNRPGLFDHTIAMLLQAKEVGLRVVINTLATKQNVRDPQLLELVKFAEKHNIIVYVNFAAPIGNWEGRYDLLLDQDDADYIYNLNRQHEVIKRDIFPYMGIKVGCPAFREIVYITQYGDVLPCPFIHISVGNIFDEPLSRIIEKGMRVKWFKDRSQVCLACEDVNFIKNKISKTYGLPSPVSMHEIFTEDEFD
ncbi:MAG: radical SAM protein [Chloroflexi bacterium]|jgi:MoaA/NifB/PqqE/SkfB family radical SAM enzyme|nr:radical SAM protein [Chloroflexota bacterium]